MINKVATTIGEHAAQRIFQARAGKGKKSGVEIHITETDLALAMSVCAQAGWDTCMAAVQKVRDDTDREIEEEGI
jgi:hypothetical protein